MKNKTLLLSSVFILVTAAIVYVAFYFYDANLIFDESLIVEKGTREFEMLISDSVKNLPVPQAKEGSVKYHYSAGDGNKPQSDSLEFDTEQSKDDVLQFYAKYLQDQGYTPQQPENVSDNNVIFGNEGEIFNVYVETMENRNQVTVYHLESTD
jgi:hypothetical protein